MPEREPAAADARREPAAPDVRCVRVDNPGSAPAPAPGLVRVACARGVFDVGHARVGLGYATALAEAGGDCVCMAYLIGGDGRPAHTMSVLHVAVPGGAPGVDDAGAESA